MNTTDTWLDNHLREIQLASWRTARAMEIQTLLKIVESLEGGVLCDEYITGIGDRIIQWVRETVPI